MTDLRIHICHGWVNSAHHQHVRAVIDAVAAETGQVIVVSSLVHSIPPPLGAPAGIAALLAALNVQIDNADMVILPAYLVYWRRFWAKPQLDYAKFVRKCPVWVLGGITPMPCEAVAEADRVLSGDIGELAEAVRYLIAAKCAQETAGV